ncbi:ALF repeat-containing protein [Streptomyces sp. NPDC048420]|uniref:ALF repeat-containing protein n=1 Tax=Streptomyces sp. NPDC048420 TaxID=3155755 RepID=UPI0034174480
MRLKHVVLTAAAAALAPALLLTTPALAAGSAPTSSAVVVTASAADDYPVDEMSDDDVRIAILRIIADPDTGKAVQRAAQRAMDGTIADQRAFLKTGLRLAQAEDDRVAIARILADPTISDALRAAAGAALDEDTPEALRYFLEVGQYEV